MISILGIAASALYSLVLLTCLTAAVTARQQRQVPGHWRTWLALAVLFGVLIVLRVLAVEEWVRDAARAALRADGEYRERRAFQAPLVAAILAIGGVGIVALLFRFARYLRGRRNVAVLVAVLATFAMLFLIALRLASLHAIDALLYGTLKLNWLIDMGSSAVVMLAAVTYIRVVRARP